jgi:ligand-binding sensor domain-containing protein
VGVGGARRPVPAEGRPMATPAIPPLAAPDVADQFPTCLADGGNGVLWAGYIRNHIVRLAGGAATVYGIEQGVELGNVLTMHRAGGRLWAGGERGVAWFDGERFVPLHGRKGEMFRGVSGIARTAQGDLWLFGTEGLSRISAEQLARALKEPGHEVDYERFDAHDGLLGAASQLRPMPSLVLGDDGLLWMATANRINWIDPRRSCAIRCRRRCWCRAWPSASSATAPCPASSCRNRPPACGSTTRP